MFRDGVRKHVWQLLIPEVARPLMDSTGSVSDCDTEEVQKLSHMAVVMAEALADEHQILRAYTARLYAMGWFPSHSICEAQDEEVKALQKDVQVQAEARYALMELMDACAQWPNLVQALHSKGLPAFHRIQSMFALRELLNEQLALCDKGLFHEVVTKGNIAKLGSQKTLHVKFLIAHGMLRRMWEVIDTDWLEKEGEILFDLKRWGKSDLQLDYWKRQASDGCI